MENEVKCCTRCKNELDEEEFESPSKNEWDEVICDDCHHELYMNICPLCEDYYEKPETPEELFFIVSKESAAEVGVQPGIYQTIKWPYFYGSIVSGFDAFFENSIKLIREIDINSVLKKLYRDPEEFGTDKVCHDCAKKFSRTSFFKRKEYVDPHIRLHEGINERAAIINGR